MPLVTLHAAGLRAARWHQVAAAVALKYRARHELCQTGCTLAEALWHHRCRTLTCLKLEELCRWVLVQTAWHVLHSSRCPSIVHWFAL